MAQVTHSDDGETKRLLMLLRQRPALVAAGIALIAMLAGSVAFGAVQAAGESGVEIERTSVEEKLDEEPGDAGEEKAGEPERIVVDVAGAVLFPTVVELDQGARVQDAIEAAGGLAEDADIGTLNRAASLTDGQKVYVPREGEGMQAPADGGTASDVIAAGAQSGSQLVNINSATATELDELPGVGPSTAQAIIEDRESNGPFSSVDDLMRVSGIGEKKLEKLRSKACV